jgi:putative oxidoreductase
MRTLPPEDLEASLLRIFSTFPDGWPGAGLVLLRVAAGGAFILQGIAYGTDWHRLSFLILAMLFLMLGASLLIGYLTPFVGVLAGLACASSAFSWFPIPRLNLLESRPTVVLATVIASSLVCLGPGAFSVDARLFGRREIIVLRNSPSSKY